MSFQDNLSSVENEELRAKLLEAYEADVKAEKDKGISSYKKKDGELLTLKNQVKEIGFDADKHGTLSSFVESLKEVTSVAEDKDAKFKLLEQKLEKMETDLQSEKTTAKRSKLEAELTSKIGSKFKGSKLLIDRLIEKGVVDIDGDTMHFKKGDEVVSFDDGLKGLETDYSDLLVVDQTAGGGDTGGNTPELSADGDFKRMEERMLRD